MVKPRRRYKNEREAYYKRVVEPAKVAADLALCVLEKTIRDVFLAWPVGGVRKFNDLHPCDLGNLLHFIKTELRYNLHEQDIVTFTRAELAVFRKILPDADKKLLAAQTAACRACAYLQDVDCIMDSLYPEVPEPTEN
jgi:hypothetical protein